MLNGDRDLLRAAAGMEELDVGDLTIRNPALAAAGGEIDGVLAGVAEDGQGVNPAHLGDAVAGIVAQLHLCALSAGRIALEVQDLDVLDPPGLGGVEALQAA